MVRHWRSKAERSSLGAQERAHLRTALLGLIDQEDNQIAIQVCVPVPVCVSDFSFEFNLYLLHGWMHLLTLL